VPSRHLYAAAAAAIRRRYTPPPPLYAAVPGPACRGPGGPFSHGGISGTAGAPLAFDVDASLMSPGPNAAELKLIMSAGAALSDMKLGFQDARATSNRGFRLFQRSWRTRIVWRGVPA
jgi:hypothetical protein